MLGSSSRGSRTPCVLFLALSLPSDPSPRLAPTLTPSPPPRAQDSLPRYSSAKYLARLSLVLPAPFAAQVVDAVLGAFAEALSPEAREAGEGEGRAQGACLAVGEMARRGVLGRVEGQEEVVRRVVECTMQVRARSLASSSRPCRLGVPGTD